MVELRHNAQFHSEELFFENIFLKIISIRNIEFSMTKWNNFHLPLFIVIITIYFQKLVSIII